MYTASEPEYVVATGINGSIVNVTDVDGNEYITGMVCDVEVCRYDCLILIWAVCMCVSVCDYNSLLSGI